MLSVMADSTTRLPDDYQLSGGVPAIVPIWFASSARQQRGTTPDGASTYTGRFPAVPVDAPVLCGSATGASLPQCPCLSHELSFKMVHEIHSFPMRVPNRHAFQLFGCRKGRKRADKASDSADVSQRSSRPCLWLAEAQHLYELNVNVVLPSGDQIKAQFTLPESPFCCAS